MSAIRTIGRQSRSCRETGFWEVLNSGSKALTRVNSLGPNPRIVIALRSPSVLAETGLTMCLAEKCQTVTAFDAEHSVLCSPVCLGLIAKYGHYSGILVESERGHLLGTQTYVFLASH